MSAEGRGHLVVIDDDREMRSLLDDFLKNEGYRVTQFPLAVDALAAFRRGGALFWEGDGAVDVVITDLKMAQMDGMEFLKLFQKEQPQIPVILVTAFGSIETAIQAMRNGAYDYVVKPFKLAEMSLIVERALEKRHLQMENAVLRKEVRRSWGMGDVLGKSPAMKGIFDLVARIAGSTSNVLITGESGSGKEMVARLIHKSGPRASKPFVAINCTAIPETLLESELFGHAKGSFTGAHQRKKGLFEEASGGTLFLDEIGDMSPSLQAKLLRVIQERKIRPVGDNAAFDVDVRVIAATHKDLKAAIREGVFREDLFYRLSVIPIVIPPLRNRPEDIPLLAEYFLKKYCAANNSKLRGFTKGAISKLVHFRWEGNVRELENLIERTVVLSQGEWIDNHDIPDPETASSEEFFRGAIDDYPTITQLEARYIHLVLEKTAGRKDKAAQILGINRRTLYRKEREYGFVNPGDPEDADLVAEDDGRVSSNDS